MSNSSFSSAHLGQWQELQRHDREKALKFYFDSILPDLVDYLLSVKSEELKATQCDTLVSLMGFSPETTVIATALLRPTRVLTIRSRGVDTSYELAAEFLISHGLVKFSGLINDEIDPADPIDIYKTIRRHLTGRDDEHAMVDVTGGKKVMSASAALAASELRIPLCYIDGQYDPQMRRPVPGTERLILLPNPSVMASEVARMEALRTYRNGEYRSAREALAHSRDLQPHTAQFEETGIALCNVYMAWMALDLSALSTAIETLETILRRPNVAYLFEGKSPTDPHVLALHRVAQGDRLAFLATLLELGKQYRARGRHDFACLLAYRCLEGFVQYGLGELSSGKFDPANPNYELLGSEETLQVQFMELAKEVGFHAIDGLPYRLGFINGFMLLCLIAQIHEHLEPRGSTVKAVQAMQVAAEKRNRSVLAHGDRNLTENDSRHLLREAERVGKAVLRNAFSELQSLRASLRPLDLGAICPI